MAVTIANPALNGPTAQTTIINALAIRDTSAHDATTDSGSTFLLNLLAQPGSRILSVTNTLNQAVSITLEYSLDGVHVTTVGNAISVAASGTAPVPIDPTQISTLAYAYPYLSVQAQCSVAPTSGTLTVSILSSSVGGGQSTGPVDANNYPYFSLGSTIAGEDIANNVLRTEEHATVNIINSNTSTSVKSGAGYLYSVEVGDPGSAWVISIYDNTSATGTPMVIKPATYPVSLKGYIINNGIYVVTSGTTAGTVAIRYR
jgi:hypothetical protein